MDETIIIAIIGGLCTGIPAVIATLASNNKANAVMNYKIDTLTKQVEKHNSVVERVFRLEEKEAALEKKVANIEKHK